MMTIVQWETFEGETFHGAVVHVNQYCMVGCTQNYVQKTFTDNKICESFLPQKFPTTRYNDIREWED